MQRFSPHALLGAFGCALLVGLPAPPARAVDPEVVAAYEADPAVLQEMRRLGLQGYADAGFDAVELGFTCVDEGCGYSVLFIHAFEAAEVGRGRTLLTRISVLPSGEVEKVARVRLMPAPTANAVLPDRRLPEVRATPIRPPERQLEATSVRRAPAPELEVRAIRRIEPGTEAAPRLSPESP